MCQKWDAKLAYRKRKEKGGSHNPDRGKVAPWLSASQLRHTPWQLILWLFSLSITIKNLQFWSLGWQDHLEEGMATHSSLLAWRILWTEEPVGQHSTGLQKSRTQLSRHPYTGIQMGLPSGFFPPPGSEVAWPGIGRADHAYLPSHRAREKPTFLTSEGRLCPTLGNQQAVSTRSPTKGGAPLRTAALLSSHLSGQFSLSCL